MVKISPLPPEVQEKNRRRVLRDAGVTLFAGLVLMFFLVVLFGNQGLVALNQASARMREVAGELEQARQENAALKESLQLLESNPAAVEGIAREQLRLARPGEEVYVFVESAPRGGE